MVDPDSGRVPRAPPYSGTAPWRPGRFAYAALTPYGGPSHALPLRPGFPITPRVIPARPYNPARRRFGLLPLRSPLLGESLLISSPALLRWFTSRGVAPPRYLVRARGARLTARGLPHSDIRGSPGACPSPRLIAACRVLRRPRAPEASAADLPSPGHIPPPPPSRGGIPGTLVRLHHLSLPSPHFPMSKTGPARPLSTGRAADKKMGRDRFELSTPALSERCSDQLSYRPE